MNDIESHKKIAVLQKKYERFSEEYCIFSDSVWISIQSFSAAFATYLESIKHDGGEYIQDADYFIYSKEALICFSNKGMKISVGWHRDNDDMNSMVSYNDTRVISGVTLKSFPK